MTTAIILFAHGARDPEWAEPVRRVQAAIAAREPAMPVQPAFLEFMSPTLFEAAERLIAEGAQRIAVVPMFIAQGGHLKRELPEMLTALRARHPAVEFLLSGVIGEQEIVTQAMASAAIAVAGVALASTSAC